MLIPHLLILHVLLIPAADILHLRDLHDPSPRELIFIKQASNRSPMSRFKAFGVRSNLPRPLILAVGSALLLSLLSSYNAERSPSTFSTVINASFSLACLGSIQSTRMPGLLPEPPSLQKQALFHRHRHGLHRHDLYGQHDAARALNAKATSTQSIKGMTSPAHLSFFVDSGASYHIHHKLSDLINVRSNSTSVTSNSRRLSVLNTTDAFCSASNPTLSEWHSPLT